MNQNELKEKLKRRVQDVYSNLLISNTWNENRLKLIKHILTDNIDNFLNWQVIVGRMTYEPSENAVQFLKALSFWPKIQSILTRSSVGNPLSYPPLSESCGNSVNHACHLATLIVETGLDFNTLQTIFEFGGGFGMLCKLIFKFGFCGNYTIFDLPEVLALQEYYLSSTLDKTSSFNHYQKDKDINFLWDRNQTSEILIAENSLFIALWSISESPFDLRDEIFKKVFQSTKYVLLGYQDEWYGYDNKTYFSNLITKNSQYTWKSIPVAQYGNLLTYIIGQRK